MDLSNLIYIQLLELYAHDLEVENMSLYLQVKAYEITKNMPQLPPYQPITQPYPWCPPYKVTCQTAEKYSKNS